MRLRSSCSRRLKTLVQSPESQGSSPFCLLALTRASTGAMAAEERRETGLPSGKDLLVPRSDSLLRERGTDPERDEQIVDLIRDRGDGWLDHIGEKTGKGKGFACVTLDAHAIGGRAGEIGLPLEEPEICPAGQETQPGEDCCGFGSQHHAADGVEKQEDGGEMFDAHLHQTLEYSDGVFGNELLEGDKEGSLDRDSTADLSEAIYREHVSMYLNGMRGHPTYPIEGLPLMAAHSR